MENGKLKILSDMKKYLFLFVSMFLLIPSVWAGGGSDPEWLPNEKYCQWISEFNVDKCWSFTDAGSSDNKNVHDLANITLDDAPGLISFSLMSWNNHKDKEDDYCLDWMRIYLENNNDTKQFLELCYIDFNGSECDSQAWEKEYNEEGNVTDTKGSNGCTLYWVHKRMDRGYQDGSQFCFFVLEYGDELRNFVEKVGAVNLRLRVNCRWDGRHWNDYERRTSTSGFWGSGFMPHPAAPIVTSVDWTNKEDSTALNFTLASALPDLYTTAALYDGSSKLCDIYESVKNVGSGQKTVVLRKEGYQPKAANLNSKNLSLHMRNGRIYSLQCKNYRKNNGFTKQSIQAYSEDAQVAVPQIKQPKQLTVSNDGKGVMKVEWNMDAADGAEVDDCALLLERSLDPKFAHIAMTKEISYNKKTTHYSYEDAFEERQHGKQNFYYRLRRINNGTDMQILGEVENVETDYVRLSQLNVRDSEDGKRAHVSWDVNPQGIWTKNMDFYLTCGNMEPVVIGQYHRDYEIADLTPCEEKTIKLAIRERQMEVNSMETKYTLPDVTGSEITDFTLSKGFYADHVTLSWRIPSGKANFHFYNVERINLKELSGDNPQWLHLGSVNHSDGVLNYSFQDETCVAGEYYQYRVVGYSNCGGTTTVRATVQGIGFAQPYGVVSGQINYSGNQAVKGVKISAIGEGETRSGALRFVKPDTIPAAATDSLSGYTEYPLEIPNPLRETNSGTIEMWVKGDYIDRQTQELIYGAVQGKTAFDIYMSSRDLMARTFYTYDNGTGKQELYQYPGDTHYKFASGTTTMTDAAFHWKLNDWNLLSYTFVAEGSTLDLRLYCNGVEVASFVDGTSYNNMVNKLRQVETFSVGRYSSDYGQYKGDIREIRIWDVARTADEIVGNMEAEYSDAAGHLVYFYKQKPKVNTVENAFIKSSYVEIPAAAAKSMLGASAGTVEMWARVDELNGGAQVLASQEDVFDWTIDQAGKMRFTLKNQSKGDDYSVSIDLTDSRYGFKNYAYNHVAAAYGVDSAGMMTMHLIVNGKDAERQTYSVGRGVSVCNKDMQAPLYLGKDAEHVFSGYMDEIRFWNIYRDSAEIVNTMDCYLGGTERGLTGYYRCDDENTGELYDLSQTNYKFNQRHAILHNVLVDRHMVPTRSQLSLSTRTDEQGNYILNAVPYKESGSLFTIVPALGIHEFSPKQRPLYFNKATSTHNSINFTDQSSFEVSGYVLYENTDYPVKGCTFTVDGTACTRDNKLIETDENGHYTISVPIGNHYITIKKEGHSFSNDGRYPQALDDAVTTVDFQKDIDRLDWTDNTKVVLTGRVAGGVIQDSLPHGMQLGKNNIGTARIVLVPEVKNKYDLNLTKQTVTYDVPEGCKVKSVATVGANGHAKARQITIVTDSTTGEFSALVPPIDMVVDSLNIPSNIEILFNTASFDKLVLSKAEKARMHTDTFLLDNTWHRFSYTAKLDAIHYAHPELIVRDRKHKGEVFGVDSLDVPDPLRADTTYVVHTILKDAKGDEHYQYGCPYFIQGNTYEFDFLACERYYNKDKEKTVADTVPVSNSKVTIHNDLGDPINGCSNVFQLDSLGRGYYIFMAGEPNIAETKDSLARYHRSISMSFTNSKGDVSYDWNQNKNGSCVVLGKVNIDGTNFITEGPDELVYILRDPPGAHSSATLEKGTSFGKGNTKQHDWVGSLGTKQTILLGATTSVGTGLGLMIISELKAEDELTPEGKLTGTKTRINTSTKTFTTTESISTGTGLKYCGAMGDVYIGLSRNVNFSDVNVLWFHRKPEDGTFYLDVEQGTSMDMSYKTSFALSQRELVDVQIPDMKKKRNQLLRTVSREEYDQRSIEEWQEVVAEKDKYVYVTALQKDDERFGIEGTYRAIPPTKGSDQNWVLYYNNQMARWENWFAFNEKAKADAVEGKCKSKELKKNNYTFDGGSPRSFSTTNTFDSTHVATEEHKQEFTITNKIGMSLNGLGMCNETAVYLAHNYKDDDTNTEHRDKTVKFNFDLNTYEQLSVDVYENADPFSPIFSTVAGQTFCPYEDAEVTQYYQPKQHILSTATQKMEDPKISLDKSMVSGIPAGGSALYEVQLFNNAGTTTAMDFELSVDNTTNPNGAQIFVGGAPLTNDAMEIRLEPNSTNTVLLELRQTDLERLKYDSIRLYFSSACDGLATYDEAFISAHFVANCPEIKLTADRVIANHDNSRIILRISDFDTKIKTFEKARLEYKLTTDVNYAQIATIKSSDLTDKTAYAYTWDMSKLVDGTYEVRVVGVCRLGNEEILYEGAPITITKDCAIPEVLGLPSPLNGIYTNDNELYVTFNEPINTALIKPTDVEVKGVMNGGVVNTDIAYRIPSNGKHAETEAAYILKNTSFSFEAWVRVDSLSDGGLVSHNGDYLVEVTKEGKLRISYPAEKTRVEVVSQQALPLHQWLYLCVQQELMDDNMARIHAHAAYDSKTLNLIDETKLAYQGMGPVQIGFDNHADMSICELQLWVGYTEWESIRSTMNQTKELYRSTLYGYWPMHEGEGATAKEIIRSRNMLLPGASWRYKDNNRGVHIPEGTSAVVELNDKPIINEDFTLEFWFRRSTPGALFMVANAEDTTTVYLTGTSLLWDWGTSMRRQPLYQNFCDGMWHHIAVIVRMQSDNEILIDGKPYLTAIMGSASDVYLKGTLYMSPDETAMDIDELRIWKATISPSWAEDNRRNRVDPASSGLLVYYPMEEDMLADIAADTLYKHPAMTSKVAERPLTRVEDGPAIVTIKNESSVPHTFTASDTKLVINITAKPSQIEGKTLNFLVKGLPDMHYNLSKEVRWSAYVHRNLLSWDEPSMRITKQVLDRKQVAITFTNRSGNIESWTISGLPEWMSVSEQSGALAQLSTKTVYLTIDESLAIGYYEPVIYLSGNQGIYDALSLSIQVTGDRPEWSVNPANFAYSMNIIGMVYQAEGLVADTTDMIAAKINGKLAGVAHPEFTIYRGVPYVMMDIYANLTDKEMQDIARGEKGPKVEFEYWDAQTGLIHTNLITQMAHGETPVMTPVYFKDGALIGTQSQPLQFLVGNTIRQEIDVVKGWNWYSFNVLPLKDTLNEFLRPLIPYTSIIKSQESYAELDNVRQQLVGSLDRIDITKMYRAQMFKNGVETLTGLVINPAAVPFVINPGWNWIGYVPNMTLSVNAAMANMQAKDGDIIKGQRGFTTYYNGQWVGSLRAMTPGAGYMYYSSSDHPTVFYYPSPSSIILSPMRAPEAQNEDVLHYTPVDRSLYSGNMTITAIVMDGNSVRTDVEVGVFAGSECRTAAHATDDRYFITVPGDDATPLQLRVWDGQKETIVNQGITFVNDAQYGTYNEPYIIQIGDAEGVDAIGADATYGGVQKVVVGDMVYIIRGGEWFDVLGHKVNL